MRRARRLTWIEFFEIRYGPIAGIFGAVADVAASVIWLGGVLFTFGVLSESLTGLPTHDAGGVTVLDLEMAGFMDETAAQG